MGAKAAQLKDRDVPAHNPLVNNDLIRVHYFKEREESKETQIRQENHFTIINKNGVVDDGKTLVGLRKRNHMGKIYFIKRKPKRYGGVEDSSQNSSHMSMEKESNEDESMGDHLNVDGHQFNESSNNI